MHRYTNGNIVRISMVYATTGKKERKEAADICQASYEPSEVWRRTECWQGLIWSVTGGIENGCVVWYGILANEGLNNLTDEVLGCCVF